MRAKLVFATGLVALATLRPARAGDVVSFGLGAQGQLGAAASTGLGPGDVAMPPTGLGADTLAKAGPSLGGPYGGIGAMAELRFAKMFGVELDYFYTVVTAKGDVPLGAAFPNPTGGAGLPTISLGFEQWHHQISPLAKLVVPLPLVAPFVAVGPEFVFPQGPSITFKPSVPGITITAHASGYAALVGVVGVEIKLPLPKVDIRVPVGARFSYNLSSPDSPAVCGSLNGSQLDAKVPPDGNCRLKLTGRIDASTQSLIVDYRTEWKYSIGGQAGVAVYF